MSFWDNEAVKKAATNSEYASLKEVGDNVEGVILKLGTRTFNEGKSDERVAIEVIFEGDAPTLTAGQTMLMQGLYELKPVPGDRLSVTLGEVQKMGAKTMKRFIITVTRPDGEELEIDQRQSADSNEVVIITPAGGAEPEPTPPPKAAPRARASRAKAPAAAPAPEVDEDEPPF